jgi:hypothetical protein
MQLRIDNHALRLRVAQMEQQINQLMLSQERTTLDLDIMRSNPGWQMDWQTGQLRRVSEIGTPPPTTAPPTATPPRPNQ